MTVSSTIAEQYQGARVAAGDARTVEQRAVTALASSLASCRLVAPENVERDPLTALATVVGTDQQHPDVTALADAAENLPAALPHGSDSAQLSAKVLQLQQAVAARVRAWSALEHSRAEYLMTSAGRSEIGDRFPALAAQAETIAADRELVAELRAEQRRGSPRRDAHTGVVASVTTSSDELEEEHGRVCRRSVRAARGTPDVPPHPGSEWVSGYYRTLLLGGIAPDGASTAQLVIWHAIAMHITGDGETGPPTYRIHQWCTTTPHPGDDSPGDLPSRIRGDDYAEVDAAREATLDAALEWEPRAVEWLRAHSGAASADTQYVAFLAQAVREPTGSATSTGRAHEHALHQAWRAWSPSDEQLQARGINCVSDSDAATAQYRVGWGHQQCDVCAVSIGGEQRVRALTTTAFPAHPGDMGRRTLWSRLLGSNPTDVDGNVRRCAVLHAAGFMPLLAPTAPG